MTFAELLPLLIQYGLPFVQQVVAMIESGGNVTSAQIQALMVLAQQNAAAKMLAVLQAHNIDPASDAGKAFLALAT